MQLKNRCIQDTLSSRAALGLPAAVQPLGRVRRASKGILHTIKIGVGEGVSNITGTVGWVFIMELREWGGKTA